MLVHRDTSLQMFFKSNHLSNRLHLSETYCDGKFLQLPDILSLVHFYLYVVSVTCSVVTVYQPPVLTSALGGDVVMPCHLSNNEKMVAPPVLYWVYSDNAKLWPSSEKYKERVDLLDKDVHSSNKSMLFKNVQWADSGKYLCKLSIMDTDSNKRSRVRGNETLLMIYGKYKAFRVLLRLLWLKLKTDI